MTRQNRIDEHIIFALGEYTMHRNDIAPLMAEFLVRRNGILVRCFTMEPEAKEYILGRVRAEDNKSNMTC